MTPAIKARQIGFAAQLRQRGLAFRADTKETITAIRRDISPITDPEQSAKGQTPVYAQITCATNAVLNPRNIGTFTEINDDGSDGRTYEVMEWQEKVADAVTWTWMCEARRQ